MHPHTRTVSLQLACFSIGYAIAKKLGLDGAKVVVSSRKGSNVTEAVDGLKASGVVAEGTVCHVGLAEDRQKLIDFVSFEMCQIAWRNVIIAAGAEEARQDRYHRVQRCC